MDWVSVPDVYAIDVIDTGKSNWLDSVSSVSLGFGLFSSEYMVGAEHNRIITKISSENPEIYDNQFGDVTGLVYDEVLTPIQLNGCATRNDSWIDPNPGNTFYVPLEDVIENIVLTTNNGQYPINTLVADYPQFANEISVLESFCDVIEAINNIADLELYTTGFIQILDSSQISPESISAIKTGMAVAIHSKYLWAE